MTVAEEWFTTLYGPTWAGDGLLTVTQTNQRTGDGKMLTSWHETATGAALSAEINPDACVWFGVALRTEKPEKGRGTSEICGKIPALWVDIDTEHPVHNHKSDLPLPETTDIALDLVNGFPLPPSAIIDSGHGLQAWWFLKTPTDLGQPFLDRWGEWWRQHLTDRNGYTTDNVFDLARIMRVPGTTNNKPGGDHKTVTVIESDPERRYGPDDIDQFLPAPKPAPSAISAAPTRKIEGRPGDEFNERVTAQEILARNGWTHHHTDQTGDHWTHPHKHRREGSSATVYPAGDVCVWSNSTQLEQRRKYDPWGLYVFLEHGGDFQAAADAARNDGYGDPKRVVSAEATAAWLDKHRKQPKKG